MGSAELVESGRFRLSVYGQTGSYDPVINVGAGGAVEVPLAGGGTGSVFSSANAEVSMEAEYSAVIAALTARPGDGLQYRLKVGQIRSYDLSFASGAATNMFSASDGGFVWGLGVTWNLAPASVVSTGFALDFAYTQTVVGFDRFEAGSTVTGSDQTWTRDEIQVAVNASRRFQQFEPFGGLKFQRLDSTLEDDGTHQKVRGIDEALSPFVGVALHVFRNEAIVLEASFLDEESFSAGFNIQF